VAITIVSYNGITKQANVSATTSDIANIKKAQEMYRIQHGMAFSNDDGLKDAGLSSMENKVSWAPEDEYLGNLSTNTPRGNYLFSYSTYTEDTILDGTFYPQLTAEYFYVAYWDYDAGKWVEQSTAWYGDVDKSEYTNTQFRDDTSSSKCTTQVFEQCRAVSN